LHNRIDTGVPHLIRPPVPRLLAFSPGKASVLAFDSPTRPRKMFRMGLTQFISESMLPCMEQVDRSTVEHVLRAMERADVTLAALAARTGIPKRTLTRRLAGVTSLTVRELGLMARALGCRAWELVGEAEIGNGSEGMTPPKSMVTTSY
jgi:hypothetical protein